MDNRQNLVISKAITQMEMLIKELTEILVDEGTQSAMITDIEKYVSNSGNTIWRCYDMHGDIVAYIRQVHKQFWEELGHWDTLNKLEENSVYGCDIRVKTFKEGDFNRINSVQQFWIQTDDTEKPEFPF